MIFLITNIFLYLLVALALGVAAGWLWRNLQASGREAAVDRRLMESRSRLPQIESTLRASEQRLAAAHAELEARELEIAGQAERLAARDQTIEELEHNCAELRGALEWATAPAPSSGADQPLALRDADRLEELQRQLDEVRQEAEEVRRDAEEARREAEEARREARREHEEGSTDSREELERLQRALATECRRVQELTQERELQRRALEALEQQLDLAREGRARLANG